MISDIEQSMSEVLLSLNLPYTVIWSPDRESKKHGLIDQVSKTIVLFDELEDDVWQTFLHEIFELKLSKLTTPYRSLTNSLIEVIEKMVYREKEMFLDEIPGIVAIVEKAKTQIITKSKRETKQRIIT